MSNIRGKTALVTGATKGIGLAFAKQLAELGCNLIITARNAKSLDSLASKLAAKGVSCTVVVADLSTLAGIELVAQKCQVDILINNAGIGCFGNFGDMPIKRQEQMLVLNCQAPMMLADSFIRKASADSQHYLVNIASIVSFAAFPGSATYSATKNFLLSFSQAIHHELAKAKPYISVTAVAPGVTETNFFVDAKEPLSAMKQMIIMPADDVARLGIKAMLSKKRQIICGWRNKALVALFKLLPTAWLSESQTSPKNTHSAD